MDVRAPLSVRHSKSLALLTALRSVRRGESVTTTAQCTLVPAVGQRVSELVSAVVAARDGAARIRAEVTSALQSVLQGSALAAVRAALQRTSWLQDDVGVLTAYLQAARGATAAQAERGAGFLQLSGQRVPVALWLALFAGDRAVGRASVPAKAVVSALSTFRAGAGTGAEAFVQHVGKQLGDEHLLTWAASVADLYLAPVRGRACGGVRGPMSRVPAQAMHYGRSQDCEEVAKALRELAAARRPGFDFDEFVKSEIALGTRRCARAALPDSRRCSHVPCHRYVWYASCASRVSRLADRARARACRRGRQRHPPTQATATPPSSRGTDAAAPARVCDVDCCGCVRVCGDSCTSIRLGDDDDDGVIIPVGRHERWYCQRAHRSRACTCTHVCVPACVCDA